MRNLSAFICVAALAFPAPSIAHGGGLDASGCHNDRKRGGYHCHRAPLYSAPAPRPAPKPISVMMMPPAPVAQSTAIAKEEAPIKNEPESLPEVTIQSRREPYWSDDRWAVYSYPEEDSCEIGITPKEDEYLTLQNRPRDKAAYLMVTNKSATSKADGERVKLKLLFLSKNDFGPKWEGVWFTVRVMPDGKRALVSEAISEDILIPFAAEQFLAVVTEKDAVVGGVELTGSREAVSHLRNCSLAAAELNRDDPFLEKL